VSSSLGPAAGARNGSEPTNLARSSFSIIHDLSRMIYRFKKDGTLELAGPAGVSALPALSSLLLFSSFLLSPFSSALSPWLHLSLYPDPIRCLCLPSGQCHAVPHPDYGRSARGDGKSRSDPSPSPLWHPPQTERLALPFLATVGVGR
jgi:hypothetical protein